MTNQQPQLILYSFRRCPYAMRARMALAYAKLNYEIREVDLKQKPDALLTASPKGTVPVLIVNEKTVIDESLDVVVWASQQTDKPYVSNINADPWVMKLHQTFIPLMHRYKYPERYPEVIQDENLELLKAFLSEFDAWLEAQSATLNPWVKMALFPLIRQLWIIDDGWRHQSVPALTQWVEGIMSSESFTKVMHKYEVWNPTMTKSVTVTN